MGAPFLSFDEVDICSWGSTSSRNDVVEYHVHRQLILQVAGAFDRCHFFVAQEAGGLDGW